MSADICRSASDAISYFRTYVTDVVFHFQRRGRKGIDSVHLNIHYSPETSPQGETRGGAADFLVMSALLHFSPCGVVCVTCVRAVAVGSAVGPPVPGCAGQRWRITVIPGLVALTGGFVLALRRDKDVLHTLLARFAGHKPYRISIFRQSWQCNWMSCCLCTGIEKCIVRH